MTTKQPSTTAPLRPPGGLRALSACFDELGARDEATRTQIAHLLGWIWPPRDTPPPEVLASPPPTRQSITTPPSSQPEHEPEELLSKPKDESPPPSPGPRSSLTLHDVAPLPVRLEWEPLAQASTSVDEGQPPQSLLRPKEQRAILHTALATAQESPEPDIPALVDILARRTSPARLPMRTWPSLNRGLQVLQDLNRPLWGLYQDQQSLIQVLSHLVGPDLELLTMGDSPFEVRGEYELEWRSYRPPAPGVPVLILSELGQLGGEPTEAVARSWLQFSTRLARRGSRCVVLTPMPAGEYAPALRARFVLLEWDRSLGVHQVLRALGGHHASL